MSEEKTPSTGSDEAQVAPGATPEAGETPAPTETQHEAQGETPAPSEDKGTGLDSALKAERDARKKAEKELAALKKAQDEGLSETERLANRVTELEAAKKAAERDALVQRIATEYSIPPVLASRIHGETEDELRSDAEALKQSIPEAPPQPQAPPVGGPQGSPSGGRTPEEWTALLRQR